MDITYILSQNKKEIFPSLHNKVTITLIQGYGKKKEIIYRSVLFINIDVKILIKIAYEMQCHMKEIRYILIQVEFL